MFQWGLPMILMGDPTLEGWTITGVYALAAVCCFAAGRRERRGGAGSDRFPRFWFLLGVVLLALTVNKQLDLHGGVTAVGREVAMTTGLDDHRRTLQALFIAGVGVCLFIAAGAILRSAGRRPLRFPLACAGIAMLVSFILLRAASFHHVIGSMPGAVRVSLELGGAVLIGVEAGRVVIRPTA